MPGNTHCFRRVYKDFRKWYNWKSQSLTLKFKSSKCLRDVLKLFKFFQGWKLPRHIEELKWKDKAPASKTINIMIRTGYFKGTGTKR